MAHNYAVGKNSEQKFGKSHDINIRGMKGNVLRAELDAEGREQLRMKVERGVTSPTASALYSRLLTVDGSRSMTVEGIQELFTVEGICEYSKGQIRKDLGCLEDAGWIIRARRRFSDGRLAPEPVLCIVSNRACYDSYIELLAGMNVFVTTARARLVPSPETGQGDASTVGECTEVGSPADNCANPAEAREGQLCETATLEAACEDGGRIGKGACQVREAGSTGEGGKARHGEHGAKPFSQRSDRRRLGMVWENPENDRLPAAPGGLAESKGASSQPASVSRNAGLAAGVETPVASPHTPLIYRDNTIPPLYKDESLYRNSYLENPPVQPERQTCSSEDARGQAPAPIPAPLSRSCSRCLDDPSIRAVLEEMVSISVNRNLTRDGESRERIAQALCRIRSHGHDLKKVAEAWGELQARCRNEGRECRYFPQLLRWLERDALAQMGNCLNAAGKKGAAGKEARERVERARMIAELEQDDAEFRLLMKKRNDAKNLYAWNMGTREALIEAQAAARSYFESHKQEAWREGPIGFCG